MTTRQRPHAKPRIRSVSAAQIKQLQAKHSSDRFFALVCDRALAGEPDAIDACRMAIYGINERAECEMSGSEVTTDIMMTNSGRRAMCPDCDMRVAVTRCDRYVRHRP